MEKKYLPLTFEAEIFKHWKKLGVFKHENQLEKPNFSIVLPPPNVTGQLHLGHAWDGTIQDALIRFKKLNGFNTYWVAGKDHAGIATQTTFEKYLALSNQKRTDFSRKDFVNAVKDWTNINANKINQQWAKMGFLLDYDNPKFTLDEDVSNCVNQTFKDLYEKGMIYRKLALVNWDVKLQTAISDIEVIKKETVTNLYKFKFPVIDSNIVLEVATTRPETMFADTCLVVNPNDPRYTNLIGLKAISPASGKQLEIISDYYVDIEYGTGVMKCTPAHDFNDYKIGNKYNQKYESCFNLDGTMNDLAGAYVGIDRLECRKQLVEKLKSTGDLISIEEQISMVGYSERTNEIVEPLLSKQWFVAMKAMANKIIEQQNNGTGVNVFPKTFNKNLITWLENIEDWCISRQLWWGHQIPAWYHKDTKEITVNDPGSDPNYVRDEDVFDTWFSSSLWPFVVFDKQNNGLESQLFYPSNVLVTAYDILFFWVARMMMMSVEITKEIPFKDVFIHGLIRDENGRKLSKSLGNFVDLFALCEKFGVDALRLFLLSNSTIGQDLIYAEEKVNFASKFLNKLWNIGNFIDVYKEQISSIEHHKLNKFDLWILNKLNTVSNEFKKDFENYNYVVGIKKMIDFTKNDFSGIYIDLNRHRLNNDHCFINVAYIILKAILIMLHPVCCFTTEKMYLKYFNDKPTILDEAWPKFENLKVDNQVDEALAILENIRSFKWENQLSKKDSLDIKLYLDNQIDEIFVQNVLNFENVKVNFNYEKFNKNNLDAKQIAFDVNQFVIVYNIIESSKIIDNNEQIIKSLKFEIERSQKLLNNSGFVAKAPKKLLDLEKEKLQLNLEKLAKFEQ